MGQSVSNPTAEAILGGGLRRAAVFVPILFLITLSLAAVAQNETNTTVTTTIYQNVSIANATVTYPRSVVVVAKYLNKTAVEVIVTGGTVIGPPLNVTLIVGHGGSIYYNASLQLGGGPIARKAIVINVNSTSIWIYHSCCGLSGNQTISYYAYQYPPVVNYVISLIPWLIMGGLVLRGSPRLSGLGAIVASVIIYVMSAVGLIPASPSIVMMGIVVGAILLWMG